MSSYEAWKGKKPNLKYLREWNCLFSCRIYDPKTSKLGLRRIKSVCWLNYLKKMCQNSY